MTEKNPTLTDEEIIAAHNEALESLVKKPTRETISGFMKARSKWLELQATASKESNSDLADYLKGEADRLKLQAEFAQDGVVPSETTAILTQHALNPLSQRVVRGEEIDLGHLREAIKLPGISTIRE